MKQVNIYTIVSVFIISIGGLLLGISANVSGASMFFNDYFGLESGSFLEGIAVSITMLGTFIGNFFAGGISDKLGRKKALMLAAFLFSFCTLGSSLSESYSIFLINRFIGGLGIGISLLVAPLYIAEIVPDKKRGFFVSFNQLNIGIGYLLAYLSNTIVNGVVDDQELKWRFMLGIGFLFPLVYFTGLLFVPESPVWLANNNQTDKASAVSKRMGLALLANGEQKKSAGSYRSQWGELFSSKMKRVLLVAFSVAIFQMACGINSVLFYAPKVFDMAGFSVADSFWQSNVVGITMVIMTIVSMLLIDKMGRKPLLIVGTGLILLSYIFVYYGFESASDNPAIILVGIVGVIVGFSISLGPITWILLSEIFPYNVKGLGISLAGMLNGIMSFVVTSIFPVQLKYMGCGGTFLSYGLVVLLCLVCVIWFYPETKGKSLSEIEKILVRN